MASASPSVRTSSRAVSPRRGALNERRVWVYTPPGESPEAPSAPLVVFSDGWAYTQVIRAPTILDNLRAAHLLPPIVAVFVDYLDTATRNRELPGHDPFVALLADELLPWVRRCYRCTTDPALTVVAGLSFGGLAAAYAALRRPNLFGNVLAQSGGFRWTREGDPEYEWLARQYVASPPLPLRFHLAIGLLEVAPLGTGLNRLVANRHLCDVLRAKGYSVTTRNSPAATSTWAGRGPCRTACWRCSGAPEQRPERDAWPGRAPLSAQSNW